MAKGITLYQLSSKIIILTSQSESFQLLKKEFFGFMVGMNHFNKKTAHFLGGTFLIGYMQYGGVWGGGEGVGSCLAFVCIKSEMVVS